MEAIACSDCFGNEGLRRTMRNRGTYADEPCPRCGTSTGAKLGVGAQEEGTREFFVDGSVVPETFAPSIK